MTSSTRSTTAELVSDIRLAAAFEASFGYGELYGRATDGKRIRDGGVGIAIRGGDPVCVMRGRCGHVYGT